MKLSERWLASEQRHAMSYERWLEYVTQDAEEQLETARKALEDAQEHLSPYYKPNVDGGIMQRTARIIAQIDAGQKGGK